MKYAPTPWIVTDGFIIKDADSLGVAAIDGDCATKQDLANAAFIVQAVNSHDELVAALKEMVNHSSCRCGGWDGHGIVPQPCDICEIAATALKKATGE